MAKDRFLYKSVVLLVSLIISSTSMAEEKIKIRSVFDINNMFCAIKTNGVLGMDNRYSALDGPGMGTSSTNSMLLLENGENDITLEVGALGWFSSKNIERENREKFDTDATCKVSLTLLNGEKRTILSQMKVSIDENGVPYATTPALKNDNIKGKEILAWQVEKGHMDNDYFIDNYFPDGMTLYQFTQKIHLKGLPEWRWVNATPFTGKPEQVLALQNAYNELWRLFSDKDNPAIKINMKELLNAWAIATDSNVDDLYNSHKFVSNFKNSDFRMIPINWNNYKVEVMNKGRLVRFVNKSDPTVYPLSYKIKADDGETELLWFTPIFSLVDGKFIPVI